MNRRQRIFFSFMQLVVVVAATNLVGAHLESDRRTERLDRTMILCLFYYVFDIRKAIPDAPSPSKD